MADLALALSGIRIALRELAPALERGFRERWAPYVVDRVDDPWLDLTIEIAGRPITHDRLSTDGMATEFDGPRVHFRMAEGSIELDGTTGRARLRPAPPQTQHFVLVNLVCAALACALPSRGAAVVHAAGIVLDDHAFLLVGSAGSGKSTWAGQAKAGGATVLSDDMVFVDTSGDRVEALATPIRDDWPVPCPPGRWPLAALLFPVHGKTPALAAVPTLSASARVTANLPFVAERLEADDDLPRVVQRLVRGVPAYDLTFAPDPAFVDRLRSILRP